jgi:hypothetical protein
LEKKAGELRIQECLTAINSQLIGNLNAPARFFSLPWFGNGGQRAYWGSAGAIMARGQD